MCKHCVWNISDVCKFCFCFIIFYWLEQLHSQISSHKQLQHPLTSPFENFLVYSHTVFFFGKKEYYNFSAFLIFILKIILQHQLGDNIETQLLENLKKNLQSTSTTPCGKVGSIFLQQLEKFVNKQQHFLPKKPIPEKLKR